MAGKSGKCSAKFLKMNIALGRPMLSAVAVSVKGFPGEGFFTLARNLGCLTSTEASAELSFWMGEERKVYDAWRAKSVAT